jgi:hypothetical protein
VVPNALWPRAARSGLGYAYEKLPLPRGGGRVPVGLAVFKTVAWPHERSRVGSTPMHLRRSSRLLAKRVAPHTSNERATTSG